MAEANRMEGESAGGGWRTRSMSEPGLRNTGARVDYFKLGVWIGLIVGPWTIIVVLWVAYSR